MLTETNRIVDFDRTICLRQTDTIYFWSGYNRERNRSVTLSIGNWSYCSVLDVSHIICRQFPSEFARLEVDCWGILTKICTCNLYPQKKETC